MKRIILSLFLMLSCKNDYELQKQVAQPDPQLEDSFDDTIASEDDSVSPIEEPDIEITYIPIGSQAVKPGCASSGRFLIQNIGNADLIINEINAYASVPADIQIASNSFPFPLTLAPTESRQVDFDVNATDAIDDSIIVVAKSNDPDEPAAYADATYTTDMGMKTYEHFVVKENRSADILMIVDNSCSMEEEQVRLASNAQLFVDALSSSRIDYRIAVITTDHSEFVGPVITPVMRDPALELSSQVNVGTWGSPIEMGIMMASKALSPTGMAAPGGSFLRTDARLSIIWISDEDDSSGGSTYTWSSDFWSKKTSPGDVSVWGIIGDPIYGCATAQPGDIYNNLISAMGGNWTSICSSDWGTPMSAVAGSVGIDSTFELSGTPVPSSIRVLVNTVESFDWVYVTSANAVSFNPGHIPPVFSNVTVEYSTYGDCN